MAGQSNIRSFRDTRLGDVAMVGGKTASLGELHSVLAQRGVRVPNGFALTARAYREALTAILRTMAVVAEAEAAAGPQSASSRTAE